MTFKDQNAGRAHWGRKVWEKKEKRGVLPDEGQIPSLGWNG